MDVDSEAPLNCLERAAELVHGDRQAAYGHPQDDFVAVTSAAKALGVDPQSGPLHHALYMVLVKVQRLVQTPDHHDSIVDLAGYARTYEMVLERRESNKRKTLEEMYPETNTQTHFEIWKENQQK